MYISHIHVYECFFVRHKILCFLPFSFAELGNLTSLYNKIKNCFTIHIAMEIATQL